MGDTYRQDILGAKRVGMKTIWLNNRHEPRALAADDPPDEEIETLSELIEKPILKILEPTYYANVRLSIRASGLERPFLAAWIASVHKGLFWKSGSDNWFHPA